MIISPAPAFPFRLPPFLAALLFGAVLALPVRASRLLIPMDNSQTDHLKAYGLAYAALSGGHPVEWLLNYRGGSFLLPGTEALRREAARRGMIGQVLSEAEVEAVHAALERGQGERVRLEKAPRIAVYTPASKQPWDDAVTLALTYAEIPYEKIYDKEIVEGKLKAYNWLHLHHEDFTGQNSKFHLAFQHAPWYVQQVEAQEKMAARLGFAHAVQMKKAVALAIRDYVEKGGFLFAMCLAPVTLDMALAAARTDIVDAVFDGTPPDPDYRRKLDFSLSLAFEGFEVDVSAVSNTHGNIDFNQVNAGPLKRREANDFVLKEFAPKYDPVPAMLLQNHTDYVRGFFGLATSFSKRLVKKSVTVLAEADGQEAVRYLHGYLGRGQFTYYGGHDPEDYSHAVGDAPTDLSLHRNSPGYRLILNNVLYPAAKPKKRKT